MARKKKSTKTYDVYHCSRCGGFIREIIKDNTYYVNEFQELNDEGYYEVYNDDYYNSESNETLCKVCENTNVTRLTVTEEVFKLLLTRFKEVGVVPYTYQDEVNPVDIAELMNGNL